MTFAAGFRRRPVAGNSTERPSPFQGEEWGEGEGGVSSPSSGASHSAGTLSAREVTRSLSCGAAATILATSP